MPAEKRDLTSAVVAITGASSGIGRATGRLLVEAGANVVLGARRSDRLDELVEELGDDRALAVATDVTDPEQCRELVRRAVERFGHLDAVVVNAGLGFYGGIEDGTDDQMRQLVEVNVEGSVWTARAAVPELRRTGGGDIVFVASVAGLRGGPQEAVYAATKFAQVGMAGAMERELRPHGIRVSAICPAGTNTEFALGVGRTAGDPALESYLAAEDVAFQIVTVLEQPLRLRTSLWSVWSMAQG